VPVSEGHARRRAAAPGVRDEQTAVVLGALSPTARRILTAAFRVLERDGYEGLSLRRIAAEAGETRSLIAYHFENKAGLVATLVDSLWHDADVRLEHEVKALVADPRGRLFALTGLHLRLARQSGLYRTYFDLLPHILRDDDARSRLTRTYRSYRRIGELCLAPAVGERADPLALATLLLAAGEGLGVQVLLDGDDRVAVAAFALLERQVVAHLGLGRPPAGSAPPASATGPVTAGGEDAFLRGLPDPTVGLVPAAGRVLRAALALLNDEGPQALTAEMLAARSGEPPSSVFYYFGDKHGLLAAVLAAGEQRLGQAILRAARPVVARSPGPVAVADLTAKLFAQQGWMRTFFNSFPLTQRDAELHRIEADFTHFLRDSLAAYLRRSGVPEADLMPLSWLCLGLMYGLAIQRLVDRNGTPVAETIETWRALLAQSAAAAGEPSSTA